MRDIGMAANYGKGDALAHRRSSGMAGGIVSAALDGLRIAEATILSKRP